MARLSGLVCVRDEEARLTDCLNRLAFCDEIIVVADRCSDRTEYLAAALGARVVSGAFPLEGPRKQAGVEACTGDWIIEIDADEWVSPSLGREIRAAIAAARQVALSPDAEIHSDPIEIGIFLRDNLR